MSQGEAAGGGWAAELAGRRRQQQRLRQLSGLLRAQAADEAAAVYRWLVALEEFDRAGGWAEEGARSCAGWLGWACGLGPAAARERLRVARALPGLPALSAAFAAGTVSYAKARAVTRVATAATEALLVDYARAATAAQLEAVVRGFRRVTAADDDQVDPAMAELAAAERRWLRWSTDADGTVRLSARLPADDGMVVVKALEAVAASLGEQPADPPAADDPAATSDDPALGVGDRPVARKRWQTPEPAAVRRADALRVLAETTLAHGPAARPGADRYQVVVVVRADTLTGDQPPPEPAPPESPPRPPAHIHRGPALGPQAAARIACDATVAALVEDALGRPLGVGRASRVVSARLRRALTLRDGGCVFPGCDATRFVDAHHVVHWANGGPTDLDNLVLLCRFHHRLVHDGGFRISRPAPGRFGFHRPDGSLLPPVAPPRRGRADRLTAANRAAGVTVGPDSLIPDWDGTRQDIDAAVGLLYHVTHGNPSLPNVKRYRGNTANRGGGVEGKAYSRGRPV